MRPPSGNVTFLFTDIERSSQLWEMHPQTMGRALAQHDTLVRSALVEHHGFVFKTVGDAFCVAFDNALNAVNAALSAQRVLAATAWEDTGPLRVRMALHSGEAEERDGDYFGQTLNRVARILAAGHGGQTLLSRVTAERVREKLPEGISLLDLGERRLKDLSRPERVYQVTTRDLPADFPPLRSLEVLPNNLPAQVTSFVGRSREMAEVKRLLGTTRLLTLTGPGGTGKTRLSLQAAAEVLDRFPHGVWLVEFAQLSDPELVPETIANTLDVREEHGRVILDTLVDALRTRRLLLVLDNCEHLIAACARTVSVLLRRCPELSILASSREALNIEGETIQSVPPLGLFEFSRRDDDLPFEELVELEAVQLFRERAVAVRPDFKLTPQNAPVLAQICWRLDGIPLAIELAAARVKVLPLEQILSRLDDRFRLLSGGSRVALPRQQTLGALIDWSYDLLSEPERILLRRLSVFVSGRTLEMAEEVCAGEGLDRRDIFDLLTSLVEKSLLMIGSDSGGETRYTLLESVWDYGDEKLTQHGETARYRRKHLDFFVRFAETAEPQLTGPEQKAWLEKLGVEHNNLTMALRSSVEYPDALEQGLRLAGALTRYWEVRSYLTEGQEHCEALLAKAGPTIAPAIRAKVEAGWAQLCWCQDRDADTRRHALAAHELYGEAELSEPLGRLEALLGYTERNDGDNEAARLHFERAKVLGEQLGSIRIQAMVANGLGSLTADAGDFVTARASKEQSLAVFRQLGDLWAVALVTGSLGRMYYFAGEHAQARQLVTESLSLSRALGNKSVAPYALEMLANILIAEGQATRATQLYGAASGLREALALAFSTLEQASHQQAMRRLRELLPEESFVQEWERGRALNLQEAVNLATAEVAPERGAARRRKR